MAACGVVVGEAKRGVDRFRDGHQVNTQLRTEADVTPLANMVVLHRDAVAPSRLPRWGTTAATTRIVAAFWSVDSPEGRNPRPREARQIPHRIEQKRGVQADHDGRATPL